MRRANRCAERPEIEERHTRHRAVSHEVFLLPHPHDGYEGYDGVEDPDHVWLPLTRPSAVDPTYRPSWTYTEVELACIQYTSSLFSCRVSYHAYGSRIVRFNVGLETASDLIADLEQGFSMLRR